jgi:ADP-L-glycero-D-manno-heptose 6-epimerase
VYGDGEEHKGTQASPFTQFRLQAERVGEIRVFEDSENYHRDFVPVSTVIDIHKKFLNIPESGIWNIGTGSTKSFLDVAQGFDVPIVKIPMPEKLKASYQAYTCADTAKVHATLAKYL